MVCWRRIVLHFGCMGYTNVEPETFWYRTYKMGRLSHGSSESLRDTRCETRLDHVPEVPILIEQGSDVASLSSAFSSTDRSPKEVDSPDPMARTVRKQLSHENRVISHRQALFETHVATPRRP
jgi:hypothetical protein